MSEFITVARPYAKAAFEFAHYQNDTCINIGQRSLYRIAALQYCNISLQFIG